MEGIEGVRRGLKRKERGREKGGGRWKKGERGERMSLRITGSRERYPHNGPWGQVSTRQLTITNTMEEREG